MARRAAASPLEAALERYESASAKHREAHQRIADNRNQLAGLVYETQQALNAEVRKQVDAAYAAGWLDRWVI